MNRRHWLLLTSLPLLLALLWLSAPLWLSTLAEKLLADRYCSDVEIDLDQIGFDRARIGHAYCRDQAGAFEIELSHAVLGYALSDLLKRRIGQLDLDQLNLRLIDSSKEEGGILPPPMLPAQLLDALPLAAFQIRQIDLQRRSEAGELQQSLRGHAEFGDRGLMLSLKEDRAPEGVRLQLKMDRENGVHAELSRGATHIVQIASVLKQSDSQLAVDGTAEIDLEPLTAVLQPWLSLPEQYPAGNLHAVWQMHMPRQTGRVELQQLDASAILNTDFTLHGEETPVRGGKAKLKLTFAQGSGNWAFEAPSQITLSSGMSIDLAALSGSFSQGEAGWRGRVAKVSTVRVNNIDIDEIHIPYLNIEATTPVELEVGSRGSLRLRKAATLNLAHPPLQWQGNRFSSRNLELTLSPGAISSPDGRFSARGIHYRSDTLSLPESDVSATFSVGRDGVTASGDASTDGLHLDWSLRHDPVLRQGGVDFSARDVRFGVGGIVPARIIRKPVDFAIDSGSLTAQGELQWNASRTMDAPILKSQSTLRFSGLNGHYGSNDFSGLNTAMEIIADAHGVVLKPSEVTLTQLQTGLPFSDISMRVAAGYPSGGKPELQIERLQASALGGEISSDRIAIDLARSSNPFTVQLHHIDAGKIAATGKREELNIEGVLDGRLPMDWTKDGLKMASGELHAPSGGVIRYRGTASARRLAATDQATRMVLDILNDFHYRQLKIGASYSPDGELKLAVHLNGKNPGYEQGRAVEFNLNIEENILQLLHALRMADRARGSVERGVQKKIGKE